jgi:hypothetical protein
MSQTPQSVTPEVAASVSEPTPIPKRPTMYAILFPTDNPRQWRIHSPTIHQEAAQLFCSASRPGSVLVTIPGDPQ